MTECATVELMGLFAAGVMLGLIVVVGTSLLAGWMADARAHTDRTPEDCHG